MQTLRLPVVATALSLLVACGGSKDQGTTATEGTSPSASASAPAAGGEQTPDAGGRVITVEMLTDDQGNNVFRPADFEAKQGDVIRYTLVSGVHNVSFPADSNAGRANLPKASDMLQLNGQTHDVKVTFGPGRYFYQCDPHALLGMVGHVTVAGR